MSQKLSQASGGLNKDAYLSTVYKSRKLDPAQINRRKGKPCSVHSTEHHAEVSNSGLGLFVSARRDLENKRG